MSEEVAVGGVDVDPSPLVELNFKDGISGEVIDISL